VPAWISDLFVALEKPFPVLPFPETGTWVRGTLAAFSPTIDFFASEVLQ
jgi:hypothetical protein